MRKGRNVFEKDFYEKHYNYMMSVVPRLIEAEKTVDEIKHSKEWKSACQYFQTLYNRGALLERPTQKNGYKIVPGNNTIKIDDIEDLLTEEQLAEVHKRALKSL